VPFVTSTEVSTAEATGKAAKPTTKAEGITLRIASLSLGHEGTAPAATLGGR
jgi:hypothetical protein